MGEVVEMGACETGGVVRLMLAWTIGWDGGGKSFRYSSIQRFKTGDRRPSCLLQRGAEAEI